MSGIQTIRLELCSPLRYRADSALVPFHYEAGAGDLLFCFDLDPDQSRSIEPEDACFLGSLVFAGRLTESPGAQLELPAGNYLFAQERDALNRDEFIEMAIEVQKDGLWERLTPAARLYGRYLFEDGRAVTQVFRPY
ncbi:hypothetical protein AGMMS49587_13240 [Spirochaetia bacterium]|nr:hypothetical protein AGMMS49587_13240 [Spirochaetia bacterium]